MLHLKRARFARIALALAVLSAAWTAASASSTTYSGNATPLGAGTVSTYVTVKDGNVPVAIGVRFTEFALEDLPSHPNDTSRCFDLNDNSVLETGTECLGDYETVLTWPREAEAANLPFKWLGLNWNAHGHPPRNVYDLPHFDVHFYMVDREVISAIRSGRCGEWADCEDYERARIPVPGQYVPQGYADVGAVVAQMGNHLINTVSPEFAKPAQRFTHTLMYGAYEGYITFIEPMVTREFLLSKPDVCIPIVQPAAWQKPARYPTQYCFRYSEDELALTISLEGFAGKTIADVGITRTFGD